MGERGFLAGVPATVKRLTLVFQKWRPRGERANEDGSDDGWVTDDEDDEMLGLGGSMSAPEHAFVDALWGHMLGQALAGKAETMEVVGYDTVFKGASAKEVEKQIASVRKVVKACTRKEGSTDEEADKRAEGVTFMSGEEYIQGASGEGLAMVRDLVREITIEGKLSGQGGALLSVMD